MCLRCRRSSLASFIATTASHITRASLALACRCRAPPTPSPFPRLARRHDGVAGVSRLSRFHLGVCFRRRRFSLASLVVTAASKSLARLPRHQPSLASLVATTSCLVSCVSRFHLGVCLRRRRPLRRSSARRRPISLARLSRSRIVGAHLPRRQPSLALLIATMALLAFCVSRVSISACASGAVILRSYRSSSRWQCHRSHSSRARVSSARAFHAGGLLSSRSASRRLFACVSRLSRFHLGVCLRRRRSSLTSLIGTVTSPITRASLALACCRRAPPTPSTFLASLGVTTTLRCSHLSRFHLGVCLRRSRSLLASLGVTAAQNTRASFAPVCRRRASRAVDLPSLRSSPPRVASFCVSHVSISARASGAVGLCVVRRHDGVSYHSHVSRASVLSARASHAANFPSRCSSPR